MSGWSERSGDGKRPARGLRAEEIPPDLPGARRIAAGIRALERGETTIEALLVAVAATRLREVGLAVPESAYAIENPNLALYAAVCEAGGDHSRYNALLRRLVSFTRAAGQLLRQPR